MNKAFMQEAIRLAEQGMRAGAGGPFGAVVVYQGQVIGRGCNQVLSAKDPTAHAEVVAIRQACQKLGSFWLKGCELYTNCEPCPMCLSAVYWARIGRVYFATTRQDAADAGFLDNALYQEVSLPSDKRKVRLTPLLREEALPVLAEWKQKADKVGY